jgi:hypothetical protein
MLRVFCPAVSHVDVDHVVHWIADAAEDFASDGDGVANVGFRNASTCVGGGVSPVNESSLLVCWEGSAARTDPVAAKATERRIDA